MTKELFWLTLTVILTGVLWVPYMIERARVRGIMGAMGYRKRTGFLAGLTVALISGIETVYYRIANMNRAVAFYQDVLGLPLKNRAANDWAEFDVGNGELALEGELATAPHQGGATVVFKSDDLHALAAKLKDNSVKIGEVEDLGCAVCISRCAR